MHELGKKTKKQLHWRFTPNASDSLLHTRGNLVPKFSFPSAQKDHSERVTLAATIPRKYGGNKMNSTRIVRNMMKTFLWLAMSASTATHPEVALPAGSLCDVHAASLSLQVLVERLVQDEAVDQVAAHVQVGVLSVNVQGDVLPLWVGQIRLLKLNHILGAVHPVHQVQRVGPPVRHDLKLPLAVWALEAEQGAPWGSVLPHAGREDEALVVLHLSEDLS